MAGVEANPHNAAVLDAMQAITSQTLTEAEQWIVIESLCLGIGLLHGRSPRDTAEFVETIAERIASGKRKLNPRRPA